MTLAFIGDNGHAREQAVRDFVDAFVGVHGTVAVDRFGGEELDFATLNDAISSIPFLSERRLVVVRDLSANKVLAEQLKILVQNVADEVDFIIVEGHIDGRSKYLSSLKKLAEVREFTHLEGDELLTWLVTQAKHQNGSISRQTAQILVDRVGTNQQLLSNELAKLLLFNPEITPDTVRQLTSVTPQSSIFTMLDEAFAGRVGEALQLYAEQRAQGMEPQAILGMIVWQLHSLVIVKLAGQLPPGEIASRAKMSPFVVRKNQTVARRLSDAKLQQLLEQTIVADKLMKSSGANPDDTVKTLITSFT